ncbi:hypothetical protein Tco_0080249 [Tanacetum coccineum]
MASLNHRLNPLFSIKECMTYGALYTRNCGCSKGSLEDKILVPLPDSSQQPPHNCTTCGDPVDGLNCRSCAFVRKFLNEDAIECLKIIESKSKVHNSRNKAVVAKVSSNSSTPGISPDVAALTTEVSELKNMMKTMLFIKQEPQAHRTDPVKAGQAELNKEKLEEIAITVNAECSAIILNKVPEKLEDPGKFLIPCALQELIRLML